MTKSARTPLPDRFIDRTVPAVLDRVAKTCPERVALVGCRDGHAEDHSVTYGELRDRAGRLAGALAELGLRSGDRLGLVCSNASAIELHIAVHAAHWLGAVAVPVSARYVGPELQYAIEHAGCKVVVYEGAQAEKVESIRRSLTTEAFVRLTDGLESDHSWTDLAAGDPVERHPVAEADPANWVYTSGTTGSPKIVGHSHLTAVACGIQVAEAWDLHPGDVYQSALPVFTSSGTNTNLMGALVAQATHIVEPSFHVADTLRRAATYGTTTVLWVTPMVKLLLDDPALRSASIPTLRRVLYGGQAMSDDFHQLVNAVFEQGFGLEVVHMIGLTEAGPSGLICEPRHHRRKPGAVGNRGFSQELTEYSIRDEDSWEEIVEAGVVGELCFRTPSIMEGYVGDAAGTADAFRDGWLKSGDLCFRDDEGFVYFADRSKDVIRRGAMNISSAEVEQAVMDHPGVAEVAAVPEPHAVLGEIVRVVVVRAAGSHVTADEIRVHCQSRLADYKVPRTVDFVDSLPRNAMGKVQKSTLKASFTEGEDHRG